MKFREVDEELFEDNPQEYIRRDAEGADTDTRRRGATDLVRGLCKSFEAEVIAIFTTHIEELLAEATADPAGAWKQKDAAIFLVTSLAVKATVSGKGATETSDLIDPIDFFGSTIYPDLQVEDLNRQPVLKADALKFVTTFRNNLTKEQLLGLLPAVAEHLMSDSQVVMSYAAHCIERLLVMKRDGETFFTEEEVGTMAEPLLTNLFGAMEKPQNRENDYLMKAILRTVSTGKSTVAGLGEPLFSDLLSWTSLPLPVVLLHSSLSFETCVHCGPF
jgi:exportin-2 (importin alpha re-exporter)